MTTICLHCDEDEREDDGSRDWDTIKRVLRTKFRIKELEILMMRSGYKRFLKAVQRVGWRWNSMLLTSFSGAFWWDSNQFGTYELRILSPTLGKSTYFTEDSHGIISPFWEKD